MTSKQKSLQLAYGFTTIRSVSAALCVSCIAAGVAWAQTPSSPGGESAATMRLVAAAGLVDGAYEAGVEIAMPPGSHTYWKVPGEAGVPPVFAFNGSENASAATVAFPVPTRITEDGLDAFGYTGTVVFPVKVTPQDAAHPTILHADVTYAVCSKICLPKHDTAVLTLNPKGDGTAPAAVRAALAGVPRPASADESARLSVVRVAMPAGTTLAPAKPTWTLDWGGAAGVSDIFAEAPEGFFFSTRKTGPASWSLTADQSVGLVSAEAVPVTLTLKRPGESLVVTEKLDVRAPIK